MDLFNALKGSPATLTGRVKNALKWYSDRIKSIGKKPSTPLPTPTPPEPFEYEKRPSRTTPPPLPTNVPPPPGAPPEEDITAPETERKYFRGSTDVPTIGKMYFYTYDPKYKAILPFYDMFPLVIPIHYYTNGFLGLNLHYLPPRIRAGFMDKLMNFAIYDDNDEIKRVRVTYDIVSASKRFKEFKPCLKRYLYSNIASKILKVEAKEWETAVFLPVHQFQKAKAPKVWNESVREIRGQVSHTLEVGQKRESLVE